MAISCWLSGCGRFRDVSARADAGAGVLRRLAGRPTAVRPCDDVQGPGDPGGQHSLRRACRVPDQRPFVVHAVSGLSLSDRVPDARTIWLFREKLIRVEAIKPLFERFDAALRGAGYIAMGGQIVDATLVPRGSSATPKRRRRRSRRGAFPRIGRLSRPSSPTRIATRVGL